MIRINLLPFRKARKLEDLRMQISIYILSVVLLVVVLGFSWMKISSELGDVKETNAKLKKELASYSEMLKQIKALKAKRKDLQSKLDVIQGLEAQKAGPVQLFDEISIAVPKGRLFLISLSEKGGTVAMSGVATDYDTVAKFMVNLEKTETIGTVTLKSVKVSEKDERSVCDFSLTCARHIENQKKEVSGSKRKRSRKR